MTLTDPTRPAPSAEDLRRLEERVAELEAFCAAQAEWCAPKVETPTPARGRGSSRGTYRASVVEDLVVRRLRVVDGDGAVRAVVGVDPEDGLLRRSGDRSAFLALFDAEGSERVRLVAETTSGEVAATIGDAQAALVSDHDAAGVSVSQAGCVTGMLCTSERDREPAGALGAKLWFAVPDGHGATGVQWAPERTGGGAHPS